MLTNDRIDVYNKYSEKFNPITGKTELVEEGHKRYACNVSVVSDFIDNLQQGRVTGSTLKVRFTHPVVRFNVAIYKGKTYKPTEWLVKNHRTSLTLEEVVL